MYKFIQDILETINNAWTLEKNRNQHIIYCWSVQEVVEKQVFEMHANSE